MNVNTATLEVYPLLLLKDNYAYLLRDESTQTTAVVDPSEAQPVLEALHARRWKLDYVLNTHHHWDHTGGNEELKKTTGCKVVGPLVDRERIPGIDIGVDEASGFLLGDEKAEIIYIPGHTKGHIAFWFSHSHCVFVGDTLFSLGCGRLFEGTPGQMWQSLSRLRALPDDTLIYCGHEYTAANLRFVQAVVPDLPGLEAKANEIAAKRREGISTIPSVLADEKRLNLFLKADDPALAGRLNLQTSGPVKVFAELRRRKDEFV